MKRSIKGDFHLTAPAPRPPESWIVGNPEEIWSRITSAHGHVYPEVDGKALGTSFRELKVAYYNLCDGTSANITCRCGIGSERATF
jgi:hypothetical protein